MSYLRTNYRITGRELDIDAIGGGVPKAVIFGGAGTLRRHGGFIMGSVKASDYISYSQSAFGAMSDWFGEGAFGAGYRIQPLGYNLRHFVTSAGLGVASQPARLMITVNDTGADVSVFAFYQGGSETLATSCASLGFVWWGLIISTP